MEPALRQRLGLAAPRAEAGAPEQPLRLPAAERALVDGNPHPERSIGKNAPPLDPPGEDFVKSRSGLTGRSAARPPP